MNETKGFTLWFTGLPSSGKTVLADAIAEEFKHRYFKVERLDGDIVRKTLTRDLGFSAEDRRMNIERVTYVAKLLTRNGVIVLSSFITPFNDTRKYSREEIGEFILIYVKCPLHVCEERDVKGMYAMARQGKIKLFTGIDSPFEEPDDADIIVETDKQTVEESKNEIIKILKEKGNLPDSY